MTTASATVSKSFSVKGERLVSLPINFQGVEVVKANLDLTGKILILIKED